MRSAQAVRDQIGNIRIFGDCEPTVGLSGFGSDGSGFDIPKMHAAYSCKIGDISDHSQGMAYIKDVFDSLMREASEITNETEIQIISDTIRYEEFAALQDRADFESMELNILKNEIKDLKFSVGGDAFENHRKLCKKEAEIKDKEKIVKEMRKELAKGFWDDYYGARFVLRGKQVDLIARNKSHRFVSGHRYPSRNIWHAIR